MSMDIRGDYGAFDSRIKSFSTLLSIDVDAK
jgi:hypothetical protein